MRKLSCIVLLLTAAALGATAQRVTVSGYITDARTGETLIGAGLIEARHRTGAVTNSYGYYSLTLPAGENVLTYSYVGYEAADLPVRLLRDTVIHIALQPSAVIEEAVVVAQRDAGIRSTYLGAIDIPLAQVQNTPVPFGEADVLKAIQMMPGVQGGTEGFTGLYVRGGGPDENLILLDGVPIYNVDHMFGLFSVFQPEAVKKVTLYKGSFPARYGGRVSSILDIRTNDGNMKETHGSAGIGLISDKLHIEGPILRDRLAYSVSARGMHTLLYAPLIRAYLKGQYANYYFYDFNGKLTWRLSDRDRFYLGTYIGNDKFLLDESDEGSSTWRDIDEQSHTQRYQERTRMGMHWGNAVGSLRWSHVFDSRLFANTTVAYNQYDMVMASGMEETGTRDGVRYRDTYDMDYHSGIRDWSVKVDFDYTPSPRHIVKFGTEYIYHTFIPERLTAVTREVEGQETAEDDTLHLNDAAHDYHGHDFSVYAEDDFSLTEHLTVNPGLHLSLFSTEGQRYLSAQPRVSAKLTLDNSLTFKAGYARMAQYVHLLSSAQVSLPIDLWVPITRDIRPVTSDQVSVGAYYDGLKGWEFTVEAYYKAMENILEYKDGTIMLGSSSWEDRVEMGNGRAMGLELLVQKTTGRTTGWLAYTLARSDRQFPGGTINGGERFPYKYDRRHSIDVSVGYKLSDRVDVNATWSFATGGTTTIAMRRTDVLDRDGKLVRADYVDHRNNFRLPPSHRLNVGFNHHTRHKYGESVWSFSIYNAYNAMNPNFVLLSYGDIRDDTGFSAGAGISMKKVTVLPFLPSISYTYKF